MNEHECCWHIVNSMRSKRGNVKVHEWKCCHCGDSHSEMVDLTEGPGEESPYSIHNDKSHGPFFTFMEKQFRKEEKYKKLYRIGEAKNV